MAQGGDREEGSLSVPSLVIIRHRQDVHIYPFSLAWRWVQQHFGRSGVILLSALSSFGLSKSVWERHSLDIIPSRMTL